MTQKGRDILERVLDHCQREWRSGNDPFESSRWWDASETVARLLRDEAKAI